VILGIVFVGTLYPLLAEAMTGEKLSVGPPYFNATAGSLVLGLVALLLFAPLLRWRHDARSKLARILPGALAALAALALTLLAPSMTILPRLALALAGGLAIASLLPLARRKPWRTPLATWGMAIAHFGVAVSLAGMAIDSSFTVEKLAAAAEGDTLVVGPWSVTFAALDPIAGPNWTALQARLDASRGDTRLTLTPQARTFSDPPTQTNETAIATLWDGQLYTVLGNQNDDGRWQLRLWWKPFVTLIWLGGALIALGGLLALLGRLWRSWRQRRLAP
jgi:cytochrome c-type biogenesis protein CcmF